MTGTAKSVFDIAVTASVLGVLLLVSLGLSAIVFDKDGRVRRFPKRGRR